MIKKYLLSSYGIAFNGKCFWSFNNDEATYVTVFRFDNGSLSHINNKEIDFLILVKGPTFLNNENFGTSETKFSINFTKAKKKFYLSLH